MDKLGNNGLEQLFCSWMTMYRVMPMLQQLLNVKTCDDLKSRAAWLELCDIIDQSNLFDGDAPEVLEKILKDNKQWIKYTMLDMEYYGHVLSGDVDSGEFGIIETLRNSRYLHRMKEQFDLLEWDEECFEIDQQRIIILDIGCGLLPYVGLFHDANVGHLAAYYGLDKRTIPGGPFMIGKTGIAVGLIEADITDAVSNDELPTSGVTVAFFGESLHCLPDPLATLKKLVERLPQLEEILVLDVADGSSLGFGMDFHMQMHGGFGKIDLEHIKMFAKELGAEVETQMPSSQHDLYRIMLK